MLIFFILVSTIYLLLTEFEGRTVSYGPSFSARIYGPSGKRVGHKYERKKRGSVTYSTDRENKVGKIFIISLGSKRWRRLQSIDARQILNVRTISWFLQREKVWIICFFVLFFSRSRTFPSNKFQVFLKRRFTWRLKQTFEFSEPYSRVRPAKLTNRSARIIIICLVFFYLFLSVCVLF